MNTNTPQQLGRTARALDDHGCDDTSFCLKCIKADCRLTDFRGDIAVLATIRMRRLVEIRVAEDGVTLEDAWGWILSGARCVDDRKSANPARAEAADRLREVLADYLVYRLILQHDEPRQLEVSLKQMEIVERTYARLYEIALEGTEPDLFEAIN